jgi:hypothetical protein
LLSEVGTNFGFIVFNSGSYHEYFLRSKRALAYKIKRSKHKGKGARKPSNPGEEPDFYKMPPLPPEEPNRPQNVQKPNDPNISLFRSPALISSDSDSHRLRGQLDAFTHLLRNQSLDSFTMQHQPPLQPLPSIQPQRINSLLSNQGTLQPLSPLETLLSNNSLSNLLGSLSLPQPAHPLQQSMTDDPTLDAILSHAVVDATMVRRFQPDLSSNLAQSPLSLEQQVILAAQPQSATTAGLLSLQQQLNELLKQSRDKYEGNNTL